MVVVWGCLAALGPGWIPVIDVNVPSLSRCFAGKLKTICLPSEAQRMGDATGQKQSKEVNHQPNSFKRRKYTFPAFPNLKPIKMLWPVLTFWRENFTSNIPRIQLNWNSSKKNAPKFLWHLYRTDLQLQETFGWGYCCQRKIKRLLNSKFHILFPSCTLIFASFMSSAQQTTLRLGDKFREKVVIVRICQINTLVFKNERGYSWSHARQQWRMVTGSFP